MNINCFLFSLVTLCRRLGGVVFEIVSTSSVEETSPLTPSSCSWEDVDLSESLDRTSISNSDPLSPYKYQCMLLGHKNKERTVNISIERENVEQSQSIKILGVHLDEQLNFSYHISEICKRTSRQVGILNRLRNLIPSNAKLHLYKSAILPHLTYCHLVWHFSRASDRRKLERLQERALRAVFNSKSDTYGFLLQQAKLTTL